MCAMGKFSMNEDREKLEALARSAKEKEKAPSSSSKQKESKAI